MSGEKISVIIPCYNVKDMVSECLDSIVAQTIGLEHLEIILIDDASADETVSVLKKYEEKYPDNIMLVLCEKNGRQGTARNIGLSYATGDFISFVDSDDWIHPDMYKVLVDIMNKNECDVVQFRYMETKDKPEEMSRAIDNIDYKIVDYSCNRKEKLLNSQILNESCTTKLYRKSLIDCANVRYAEGVAYEEPMFTYPMKFYVNKVAVTETKLYYYRYNEKGTKLSYMNNPSTMVQHLQVQLNVYLTMLQSDFFNEYKDEIDLYFIHSFYAETFYFMAGRGMPMLAVMLRYMAKTVKEYVPDYRNNPYIGLPGVKEEMKSLELIDKLNLTDKELEYCASEYMKGLSLA